MSFEDYQYVDVDWGNETFSIITNAGTVRTYNMNEEPELLKILLEAGERGDLEVYIIEERTSSGQRFSEFESEIKDEYKQKYGEDFEDWRW